MAEASPSITEFFDTYAQATGSPDLVFLGSAYADTFMFAGPGGVQAVRRDDFLKVVPKRSAFFRATGLVASEVRKLDEITLDEKHAMVQVYWSMRFEMDASRPIVIEAVATYVLRREGHWQIVFQLDHQDLTKRVQELGLLPPSG